jgi:hypothetical protein
MRYLELFLIFSCSFHLVSCFFDDLKDNEIAIVQFDSRPLRDYWLTSSLWNHDYATRHGHLFLYYNLQEDCHYLDTKLAQPSCKVKAMIQVMIQYSFILIIFLF